MLHHYFKELLTITVNNNTNLNVVEVSVFYSYSQEAWVNSNLKS